jgi:hypothetical protein
MRSWFNAFPDGFIYEGRVNNNGRFLESFRNTIFERQLR